MTQEFEIKRKYFEVIETLGPRSYKVERKGKIYFLKDFGNDDKGFWDYVESEGNLDTTGISHPSIYTYDKRTRIVATEFVEGTSIMDLLIQKDLEKDVIDSVFKANWFSRQSRINLDYSPNVWKLCNGKLFYIGLSTGKFDDKNTFEKHGIRLWFYTRDFVSFLSKQGIRGDLSRIGENETGVNKRIALAVIEFFR